MSSSTGAPTPSRMPGMGWRPDSPRFAAQDYRLYASPPSLDSLPAKATVEALMPPVMDQRVVSGCTGYSAANAVHAILVKDGHRTPYVPSPVFLYRQARVLGGYLETDEGAEIRNVWKGMAKWGVPPISAARPSFGPADLADPRTEEFPPASVWRREPTAWTYTQAERRQMLTYYKLPTLEEMLRCVADNYPVNFGFPVYRSLYGLGGPLYDVPDPAPAEQPLGGHAVTLIGYDKAAARVLCRNQWGADAHRNPGDGAGRPNFTLTFDFMRAFAQDAWTGRLIEGGKATA